MKKISNNLVLELHIPDFEKAKKFYTIFGFKQALCLTSEGSNRLEYMTLKREDAIGIASEGSVYSFAIAIFKSRSNLSFFLKKASPWPCAS